MGSEATLNAGNLELDWGQESVFTNHSTLFLPGDVKKVPYPTGEGPVMKDALCRKLPAVKKRLELMGYSLPRVKAIYRASLAYLPDYYPLDFHTFANVIGNIDLAHEGEIRVREIFAGDREVEDTGFEIDPYVLLRILMEKPANGEVELIWRYFDLLEEGWLSEDNVYEPPGRDDRFLIVTDESNASFIVKRAIDLIFPEISDFFTYIDMDGGYPFPGKGDLHSFLTGLARIDVQNKILLLYDNDFEGAGNFERVNALDIPPNISAMKLPELDEFREFPTKGPGGGAKENINGKAVKVECFLDLCNLPGQEPSILWDLFDDRGNPSRGTLEHREDHLRAFRELPGKIKGYDFNKLETLIERIYDECLSITQALD